MEQRVQRPIKPPSMPRIFDNIDLPLLGALKDTLQVSDRSDFCVGYFNLRGSRAINHLVERWPGGAGNYCRLLVGMHRSPDEELRVSLQVPDAGGQIDNQTSLRRGPQFQASRTQAVRPTLADLRLHQQRGLL